jgi:ribosome biogenesis GTPase
MPEKTTMQGTLVRGIGSFYTARDEQGNEYTLRCKKKFRRERMTPLTGDEIIFTPGIGEEHGWIETILERKNEFIRPPVANITQMVLVTAPVPETDWLLADRMIARAIGQGIKTIIAVNKSDLDPMLPERIREEYRATGIPVTGVSARNGRGLEKLRAKLQGEINCLAGQSGAGKSTLLNAMLGLDRETGEISGRINRGKNTTRTVELLEKDGIRIMDTAGFNLLEPEKGLEPKKLKERYPEFAPYEGRCRFRECLHDREPGCAATEAAEKGLISQGRLDRYRALLAETRTEWDNRYE